MCGCSTHRGSTASTNDIADGLTLRVEDMTCGGCANRITRAIEAAVPGAVVEADPATRTVRVRGTTDLAAIHVLIAGAGYTPGDAVLA